jgi:hypothetical protein
MKNDIDLLCETGIWYRHPLSYRTDEKCPSDLKEFKYESFRHGKSFGINRLFVDTRNPLDFHKLIDRWNHMGAAGGYCYIIIDNQ